MSTMLLAAFTLVKDCSQLLLAAQCSNILNNTVLTGWQLLRMTWFSSWLQGTWLYWSILISVAQVFSTPCDVASTSSVIANAFLRTGLCGDCASLAIGCIKLNWYSNFPFITWVYGVRKCQPGLTNCVVNYDVRLLSSVAMRSQIDAC